ncbi:hypothetical protein BOTNAR_0303g00110 [Botryotinia narcissicola]|uniref:Uncharacterized protein n=1 Tax=Botryotinia narcissicola TaxID=278944 RepID=A0A4Z1HVE1_9HELO|nr:hypothetical protein BOTNAR_0303g00110 [Botryotinia narcissicola]
MSPPQISVDFTMTLIRNSDTNFLIGYKNSIPDPRYLTVEQRKDHTAAVLGRTEPHKFILLHFKKVNDLVNSKQIIMHRYPHARHHDWDDPDDINKLNMFRIAALTFAFTEEQQEFAEAERATNPETSDAGSFVTDSSDDDDSSDQAAQTALASSSNVPVSSLILSPEFNSTSTLSGSPILNSPYIGSPIVDPQGLSLPAEAESMNLDADPVAMDFELENSVNNEGHGEVQEISWVFVRFDPLNQTYVLLNYQGLTIGQNNCTDQPQIFCGFNSDISTVSRNSSLKKLSYNKPPFHKPSFLRHVSDNVVSRIAPFLGNSPWKSQRKH